MADTKKTAVKAEEVKAEVKTEAAPVKEEAKKAPAKKAPAKKAAAEKKPAEKKETVKAEAPKKEAAKKEAAPKATKAAAKKAEPSETIILQYNGVDVVAKDILTDVRAKLGKKKVTDLKIYVNVTEGTAYVTADGKPVDAAKVENLFNAENK